VDINVVLSVEKFRHMAEVKVNANGFRINGVEETEDLYSSVDRVLDKLEIQIKKKKDKMLKGAKARPEPAFGGAGGFAPPEEEEGPRVVREELFHAKPLDIEDAILELTSSRDRMIMYKDAHTGVITVLYEKKDGSIGLVEAE
jgi:putative sigma-54 modulation protein